MLDSQSLVGKEISGCEILAKVATGGMGAVFKARHKALNRIVCVKVLSPALANDKKAVSLFLTEARAIAELDHPNIVNVYNVGKEQGFYFIVMSFVEGQTLSALLKKERVLPIGQVLDLFDGVLQGLSVAHEKGIIHRDIKPSNILITPEGKPKIVDFGIAKKVDKSTGSTKTTELAGTAYFIAPEQALGKDIDTRADLYSIGASMYYVLTGHFPYNGKNTIEIIQKHINEPVPDPSNLRPEMPGWLSMAIQKLMSKNPDDRFQTAKETYTYFNKMRAEEQLRVDTMHGRAAIDLGIEGPLRILKEEKLSTETLRKMRPQDAYRAVSASQSARHAVLKPNAQIPNLTDLAAQGKQPAKSTPPMPPTQELVSAKEMQGHQKSSIDTRTAALRPFNVRTLLRLLMLLPLFIAFAIFVTHTFFTLGKICSAHFIEGAGFIQNLIAPFYSGHMVYNQLPYTALALLAVFGIFAISSIQDYARTTAVMIALAITAYLAGFFTPNVQFFDSSHIGEYLFSSEYYLCYLVFFSAWALSMCWRWNRSVAESVLGMALVAISAVLVYRATQLTLVPDWSFTSTKVLFAGGLLLTLASMYYMLSRGPKAVLLPTICLVGGLTCLWFYNVSGLANHLKTTVTTLANTIPVAKPTPQQKDANQELVGVDISSPKLITFAADKAVNYLSPEEKKAFLENALATYAGPMIPQQYYPMFTGLLSTYYMYGPSKITLTTWDYALNYPIENFNRNAQEDNAYYFLVMILFVMAILHCISGILLRENL